MSDKDRRKRKLEEIFGALDEEDQKRFLSMMEQALEEALEEGREQGREQTAKEYEQRIKQTAKEYKHKIRITRMIAKLHKSRNLQTLMDATEDKFLVKAKSCGSHTYDKNHAKALVKEIKDFNLSSPDCENKDLDKYVRFQSYLLQALEKQNSYGSKADICLLISKAAVDAVSILELEGDFESGELQVYRERSLLACRPDIMVVRDQDGVGLITIKVKKPATSSNGQTPNQ